MSLQELSDDKEKVRLISTAAFTALDTKKAGFLDRSDLELMLAQIASELSMKRPSREEMDDLIADLTSRKDGKVSLDDFENFVKEVLKSMAVAIEGI